MRRVGSALGIVTGPEVSLPSEADDDAKFLKPAEEISCRGGVRELFDQFDNNGEGLIGKADFRKVLLSFGMGEHFADEEIDTIVDLADANGDKFINLEEFTAWLYSSDGQRQGASPSQNLSPSPEVPADHRDDAVGQSPRSDEPHDMERTLRLQLIKLRERLEAAEQGLADAREALAGAEAGGAKALRAAEEAFEEELEASLDFWRLAAKSSHSSISQSLDLGNAELLGSGKYGFVFKARLLEDDRPIVVKLLGLRWAHVAVKEWGHSRIAEHPNIVQYGQVMLHADDDESVAEFLRKGQALGKVESKRTKFPDRYICLTEEFMNRGTVQDWMDQDLLLPGGMFTAMRDVAKALSYMHQQGLTHNDIKPENVLLHQYDETNPKSKVTVKLADLGLTAKSEDRSTDFSQYGMFVYCMATGERFGARKFQPELVEDIVSSLAVVTDARAKAACGDDDDGSSIDHALVRATLTQIPRLLKRIWQADMTMQDVAALPHLQRWGFFDGHAKVAQ